MNQNFNIPKEIIFIAQTMHDAGFEVFFGRWLCEGSDAWKKA
jgi:hypothetical protein